MQTEKIKITDIIPSEYNPRTISNEEYNKLSKSISEFGLVDPIIINMKNKHIIGGHQRYDVLHDEYMRGNENYENLILIPVDDIGLVLTEQKLTIKDTNHEKALNLSLNKISGEWDIPKLQNILNELTLTGIDIELTGFNDLEIKDMELYEEDYHKDEFDNLVEEYTTEHSIDKNENWLYIEYYEDDEKFNDLMEILDKHIVKGKHELDSNWFYELIINSEGVVL